MHRFRIILGVQCILQNYVLSNPFISAFNGTALKFNWTVSSFPKFYSARALGLHFYFSLPVVIMATKNCENAKPACFVNGMFGSLLTCAVRRELFIYGSTALMDLGRFFSFLILVGRTPWPGEQPVARSLPTQRITQTQNKRTQTSMP
jgi:hypothetical protein